jgi:tetratricopeptide (TPR) repeat protein
MSPWLVPGLVLASVVAIASSTTAGGTDAGTATDSARPDAATRSLTSDEWERQGAAYEKRRDWKECARSLLGAAEAVPEHPRHAQRLAEAARCFEKAHLVGAALQARQELIRHHPRDPLARDALFDVAAGYHRLAYYTKAMDCYVAFAEAFPLDGRAPTARANAAEFGKAVDGGDAHDCIAGFDPKQVGRNGQGHPGQNSARSR